MNTTPLPLAISRIADAVNHAIDHYALLPSALFAMLESVQKELGFIPTEAMQAIAKSLHLSEAEVYGVVTFYPHFTLTPPTKHLLYICRASCCQQRGSLDLIHHAEQRLGCSLYGKTADGLIALNPAYGLGCSENGPNMTIDGQLYTQITPEKFDRLVMFLNPIAA